MSGFFCMVRSDGDSVSPELLKKIEPALASRGADSTNIWNQREVGGCFALLRTGSRQAKQQPVSVDDRYWLFGDVRLDGRAELVERLSATGTAASIESNDEELLLHAWQCWGESALPELLGDFSFGIWDLQEKRLYAARDFVGGRPFFYGQFPGGFCFSNTFQAIARVPQISRELDERFIGDFLLKGWGIDLGWTVYRGICRLPAGHQLRWSRDGFDVREFLRLPIEEPANYREAKEVLAAYEALLERAVADRLPPKGPVSLFLSGGVDSGAVCTVATKIAGAIRRSELKAFTISWQSLLPDDREAEFAVLTAKHLGIAHEIIGGGETVRWPNSLSVEDGERELAFAPIASMRDAFFGAMARHARVGLAGDGGDDVLTGQAWPYLRFMTGQGRAMEAAQRFGGFALAHGKFPPLRAGLKKKVRHLLGKDRRWDGYPSWLNPEFEKKARLRERWEALQAEDEVQHPVHPIAYSLLHSHHWSTVLEDEDAGITGLPFESRTPMLDLRVLKFLLRLPPIPWCVDKFLLRSAMTGRMPAEVLRRPKTPLAGDPLEALTRIPKWYPALPANPPPGIYQFLNWEKFTATFNIAEGSVRAESLRPLALARWLKAIENG